MKKSYSTNSWHYHLATKYGKLDTSHIDTDICQYLRSCTLGAFFAVLIVLGITLATWTVIGAPVLWLYFELTQGSIEPSPVAQIGVILWICATIIAVVGSITICWITYIQPKLSIRPILVGMTDTFVVHAYQSISKKMCFKIEFAEKVAELANMPHKMFMLFPRDIYFTTIILPDEQLPVDLVENADYIYDITADKIIKSTYPIGSEEQINCHRRLRWSCLYDLDRVKTFYVDENGRLQEHHAELDSL